MALEREARRILDVKSKRRKQEGLGLQNSGDNWQKREYGEGCEATPAVHAATFHRDEGGHTEEVIEEKASGNNFDFQRSNHNVWEKGVSEGNVEPLDAYRPLSYSERELA